MTTASRLEELAGHDDDQRCLDCGLLSCVCFDDDPVEDEDEGWDECGMTPDGFCMLAGTEWCDWDCPRTKAEVRASLLRTQGESNG